MSFDLSDPKIILALMIGAMVPYLLVEVPTTIFKWLLCVAILGRGSPVSTLLVVAIAEPVCFFLAMIGTTWLSIPRFLALVAYAVLATFPNLLLFPSANQHGGNSILKRGLSAFALALLYPVWLYLALWADCTWHGSL